MRILTAALLLASLLVPSSTQAADEKPVAPPPPSTLAEIEHMLADLGKRVTDLVAFANQDPDEIRIDMYAAYSIKQLRSTRGRDVRAEDLVDFMCDEEKNFNVRRKAMEVLKNAKYRGDPDLSTADKKYGRTRRADFCLRNLVKHLRDDDLATRKLVHEVLRYYFPGAERDHAEIRDVKDTVDKTWKQALAAWKHYLPRH